MAIFRQLAGRNTRRGSGKRLGPRAELGAIRQVPSQQSAALDQAEESTSFSARSLSLLLCSNVRGSISKNEDFAPATKPQAPSPTCEGIIVSFDSSHDGTSSSGSTVDRTASKSKLFGRLSVRRSMAMSGAVYHCPYCGIGGQYRSMIPLGQSDNYRCGGCRHTIVESAPSYVCSCLNCRATSERIDLVKTAREDSEMND